MNSPQTPVPAPAPWRRLAAFACSLLLACLPATLAAQGTGTITGVVTDPRGAFLQGAEISVDGSTATATTDRTGRYRLDGIAAGPHTVRASYLGLDAATGTVTVGAGVAAALDLAFKDDTITMEQFVVESIAEGQARATNRQRASDTLQNIIAADALGRLPDASVGEALARLPGISVQVDRGEPDKIAVRGLSPKYNSVTLNGDRIPAISDTTEIYDNRSVSLNTVPTDMISSIEVTKALTPDMDADSLGGAVNLVTKSSLDFQRRVLSGKLEYGYNDLTDADQYAGNFTYGDHFAGGRVGLLLNGAYQFNNRGIEGINAAYRTSTVGGVAYDSVLNEIDLRFRHLDRVRRGLSGQLDLQTTADSRHYIRALYNVFEDREQRRRQITRLANGGAVLAGTTNTTGVIDGGRVLRRDRSGKKQTDLISVAAGGKWDRETFQLDYGAAYAWTAFKVRRTEAQWEYRLSDYTPNNGIADFTYDRTDFNFPTFTDPFGHLGNNARIEIGNRGGYNVRDDDNTEEDLSGFVNLTIPTTFGANPAAWKFGVKYRTKEKDMRPQSLTYSRTGQPELTLNNFLDPNIVIPILDGRYTVLASSEMVALREHFFANPALFTFNQADNISDNIANSYVATEDVLAAYAQASVTLGRLRLVGGVRYERTENDYTGNLIRFSPTGAFLGVSPNARSSSYDELFPALVATYRFTDRMLLRAAITHTIARPDYGDLAPRRTESDNNDRIVEGNPDLDALTSRNLDLSFEWYLSSAGLFSVGVFHKDIENFTYSSSSVIAGGQYAGWTLIRPENGPSGTLRGVEVGYSQAFKFLPAPFDGLGVQANFTALDGEADVPGRGTLGRIPDQVEKVYNLQLYYEKYPFSARVAYNYNGSYIRTLGGTANDDEWFDDINTLDASVSYTLRRGWQLYLEGKNITDEVTRRIYLGRPDRPTEHELPGWSMVGGVKFEF